MPNGGPEDGCESELAGRDATPVAGSAERSPGAGHRGPLRGRLARWLVALGLVVIVLRAGGCMERLFYMPTSGQTPLPAGYPGAEGVWFHAADGTRLYGWFLPAVSRSGEGLAPTVVNLHGNAGNIESHLWFTEYLPAAGFNLFIFDYRGYGQSAGSARRRGDLIGDAHAALDVVLARPDVDPASVGVFGQSLGGAIGLNLTAERPEIAAAVFVSSFASWREVAADAAGSVLTRPVGRILASLLVADDRAPVDAIARIDRPVLLIHGDDDRIVPVSHGRRLAAAGRAVTYEELKGGDHNGLRVMYPEMDDLVVAFLREHLAGGEGQGEAQRH